MGRYMFGVCLMALVQAVHIRCHTDMDAENVVAMAQEDSDDGIDSSEEPQIFSPPLDPQWGPNKEFQKEMHERMQERLADLKAQYEALNDTEKAEIQQKADELREKVAMMPPPPPPMAMCPPPPPCDCEDDDEEEDEVSSLHPGHHPGPQPLWRRPVSPYGPVVPYGMYPQSHYPQMHHQGHLGYRFHGPINDKAPTETPSHRSRRDLARLRQTFSVTDPNEWWQDIDSGRGNSVSDSIASWDLGAATQHSISRQMDHFAPALHIGTINRGIIANPAAGGPADRIFGYNPDFNRGDWHAFKFKPRGQFQNYKNKPLDYFKSLKYLPTGAEFFYNPNPSLGSALTGVSVNPSDKNVYSDKFLSGNPGQNLPRGTYKLEWIQMVPTKDQKKVAGFNMVVKNSQTGKHFRLDNADVNQFQGASPFRQQFKKVAHRWGGGGLAQGPTGSVYDRNIVGYRIDSAQRYFNDYNNRRSPRAVDGGWSNWGEYGECSKDCGGGTHTRTRTCTNPVPQHGGSTCEQQNIGDDTETEDCNIGLCGTCRGGATLLSTSPRRDMVLCKDKTKSTCEKDFESLCPAGWNLCHPKQFNNRNHGWDYNWEDAKAGRSLGVIYCYGSGGTAFHYDISSNAVLSTDQPLKCGRWSSRPGCERWAGLNDCNDKEKSALCCAPTRTCGDGRVQQEEDCDDGNDSNIDSCLNSCTWRKPSDHGLGGC